MPRISDITRKRLAKYWFRAQLMRDIVHLAVKKTDELEKLPREYWWDFETFLLYWLSTLFVVVKGFNKLKLKNDRVQRLFKRHLGHLERIRNETYNFVIERSASSGEMISKLHWAEELHDAIDDYIKEVAAFKIRANRFLKKRAQFKRHRKHGPKRRQAYLTG